MVVTYTRCIRSIEIIISVQHGHGKCRNEFLMVVIVIQRHVAPAACIHVLRDICYAEAGSRIDKPVIVAWILFMYGELKSFRFQPTCENNISGFFYFLSKLLVFNSVRVVTGRKENVNTDNFCSGTIQIFHQSCIIRLWPGPFCGQRFKRFTVYINDDNF